MIPDPRSRARSTIGLRTHRAILVTLLMTHGGLLAFGPFVLDTSTRRLTREGEEVLIGDRQLQLLCLLTSRPGEVLSKDVLIDTGWRGVAVTTNSLDQAISTLLRTLTLPSIERCFQPAPLTRVSPDQCLFAATPEELNRQQEHDQMSTNRGRLALKSI